MSRLVLRFGAGAVNLQGGGLVKIISGGPMGERGVAGGEGASGTSALLDVWLMQHDLNMEPEELNPSLWYFENLSGDEMEPVDLVFSTNDIALAVWDVPVAGTWRVR